ncbi:L-aspartate oxidase [Serpentinicella sp. ANB-PHB4]|uniref:L-aspartate oxidase n=1 Tax=Serpentinicella sp. ANB-PHB4 TaxID=3074076 RepID=UPI00286501FF|nr:L-aspartate oxidase [Serpentinicella sp. ANB-PHB4]MDR5659498.1 L-aspartate oxidase [Serpentinicella sp. ANB-PHB4]
MDKILNKINFNTIEKIFCDVVILGSGIAGIYTALNIGGDKKVKVLTKSRKEENNTYLAQGGIAGSFNPKIHFSDTLMAGSKYNNKSALKVLVEASLENIQSLMEFGVPFDRDEIGDLKLTREGGHTHRSVLHVKDTTGKAILQTLLEVTTKRQNIEVQEEVFALELLVDNKELKGVLAIDREDQFKIYYCNALVMATGGIGHIFGNTTNCDGSKADGIAMAHRAGAKLKDMEFIQFHPTALYSKDRHQKFLISEALRGEGAILKNIHGVPFMKKYSPMLELAPRDVVARSIYNEMTETNCPYVYLDITHKDSDYIKSRFPMIFETCMKIGLDITKEMMPVAPAEHYIMGGIRTNINGETTIKRLYACGECACTGVHGANRLASNSLLEGIVFGKRVAQSVNKNAQISPQNEYIPEHISMHSNIENTTTTAIKTNYFLIQKRMKSIMNQNLSVIRTEKALAKALTEIVELKKEVIPLNLDTIKEYVETLNMLTVAETIIIGAIKRKESLGAHYRIASHLNNSTASA